MLKTIIFLLFLPSLFLFFISEKPETVSNSSPTPSPTKTPANEKQEGVENLILDNETVYLPCPPDAYGCPEDGLNVKVKTLSKSAEKNNLNYYYTVSGGKIIGQGADVIWNLSQTRLGKYTITAGVGKDNVIRGKILTKTIEIKECDCHFICECPTISVSSSKKTVNKGELIEFKVDVNGGTQDEVKYNWTVENGIIFEGQGTLAIKVQVLTGESVTAIVEIGGLCDSCSHTDSESVKIVK